MISENRAVSEQEKELTNMLLKSSPSVSVPFSAVSPPRAWAASLACTSRRKRFASPFSPFLADATSSSMCVFKLSKAIRAVSSSSESHGRRKGSAYAKVGVSTLTKSFSIVSASAVWNGINSDVLAALCAFASEVSENTDHGERIPKPAAEMTRRVIWVMTFFTSTSAPLVAISGFKSSSSNHCDAILCVSDQFKM